MRAPSFLRLHGWKLGGNRRSLSAEQPAQRNRRARLTLSCLLFRIIRSDSPRSIPRFLSTRHLRKKHAGFTLIALIHSDSPGFVQNAKGDLATKERKGTQKTGAFGCLLLFVFLVFFSGHPSSSFRSFYLDHFDSLGPAALHPVLSLHPPPPPRTLQFYFDRFDPLGPATIHPAPSLHPPPPPRTHRIYFDRFDSAGSTLPHPPRRQSSHLVTHSPTHLVIRHPRFPLSHTPLTFSS